MDTNLLNPALEVTVEIRDADIKHGHIAKCRSCPAVLAANRATALYCDTGGVHLIAYDNGQFIENSNLLAGLLPEAARVWIARFDEQRNGLVSHVPAPLSFPLELYRVTDFTKRTYDPEVREMLADAAEVYLSVAQIIEVDPNPAVEEFQGRNRHYKWRFGRYKHGAGPSIPDVYRQAGEAGADFVIHRGQSTIRRLPNKYRAAG